VEAGRRAGCRTVLLDVGHETEWLRTPLRTPHHCARDLLEAARTIVAQGEPAAADLRTGLERPEPA
jgi:D-glycero-D-manno-heptose 1,7-bisphosphate phosphatase